MTTLRIYRGLPGCGKSTDASAWVAADPKARVRVNRDDVRDMMHGARLGTSVQEEQVTVCTHATIRDLLMRGVDVACDDTNLRRRDVRALVDIAARAGAEVQFVDMSTVPLETVLAQNERRAGTSRYVPPEVIREKHTRFIAPLKGRGFQVVEPTVPGVTAGLVPYVPPADKPEIIICDMDGTAAIMCNRSPYPDGEHLVGGDTPNPAVARTLRAMWKRGVEIVFVSARTEGCRDLTEAWIDEHLQVPYLALFMRPVGDQRNDAEVKAEIFDREIREHYRVLYVLDDRDRVVKMWRKLGLTVFQVADGNF